MNFAAHFSIILILFTFSQLNLIFCSSSSIRKISHKTNAGVAAASIINSQQFIMDEWAPYRMAFLFILVACSIALWVSYKLLCEHHHDNEEEQQQGGIAYRPLRQNSEHTVGQEQQNASSSLNKNNKFGYQPCNNKTTKHSSFSSTSSSDDDDLTCLLIGGEAASAAPTTVDDQHSNNIL
jgi:hypothetical protein